MIRRGRGPGTLRWLASLLAAALALPVLVPGGVLLAIGTDAGRDLITTLVYALTRGQVALEGLTGALPQGPRVARLELRDAEGVWLRAEDVALDLEPRSLVRREIGIFSLTARSLALLRLPAPSGAPAATIRAPWPVRVDRLAIARLDLGALAPGAPELRLAASGQGAGDAWRIASARLDADAGNLEVRGTLSAAALALGWTLDLRDLGALVPGAAGPVQGRGEVAGPPGAPELTGQLTGRADLLRAFLSDAPLDGALAADFRLTGTPGGLAGSARARAEGLRLTEGAGRSLPPASVQLTAEVGPAGTDVEVRAEAGSGARLGLTGRIRGGLASGAGTLDLRADGRLDLALLDPLLTGSGRRLTGQAVLDGRVTGTLAAPALAGSLGIAEGGYWDRSVGLALTEIQGRLGLAGETLRVEQLGARAGPGTLALQGDVGLLATGLPVDLRLTARDARPLQRDEIDLQGDAELRLTGAAAGQLTLAGAVSFDAVDVRVPERLPAAVATLEVREQGQRRAEPPGARRSGPRPLDLALDLTLAAPRKVAVRGRGIDAELGGEIRARGTLAAPAITGGFDLIRGQFTLLGQALRFARGRIGFDGATGLDPTLDLEARNSAAGGTAILAVRGTASAPRIELRGEPEMPQDEVLSRLLFGVPGGRLSPWQATRLGLAAASLAGTRGGEAGPLTRIGRGLGLNRLGLMGDDQGDAALEGGRDLSDRAYLGARQSSRTGEPQGVLRFEATPRIQLEADVGPVGGTRAGVAFEHEF